MSQLDGDPDDLDNQGMTHSQTVVGNGTYYGSGNFGGTSMNIGIIRPTPILPVSQVSIPTLSTEPASTVNVTPTYIAPVISQPTSVLDGMATRGPSVTSLVPTTTTATATSTTGSSGLIIALIIIAALYIL